MRIFRCGLVDSSDCSELGMEFKSSTLPVRFSIDLFELRERVVEIRMRLVDSVLFLGELPRRLGLPRLLICSVGSAATIVDRDRRLCDLFRVAG